MKRRVCRFFIFIATVSLVQAPALARADGFLIPWAGVNFGNDQAEGKKTFGVSAGFMGAGVIGGEIDFGYSPNFFGESVDNHALTLMGNLIIGVPVGGQSGLGIRPYVTGGAGMIRQNVNGDIRSDSTTSDAGFDLGAGVMGYFSDHIGLRGDLRYFRTFKDTNISAFSFDVGNFHFWRGSIGVVIR